MYRERERKWKLGKVTQWCRNNRKKERRKNYFRVRIENGERQHATVSVQQDSSCLAWCCHGHRKEWRSAAMSYCCNAQSMCSFLASIHHCHNHFETSSLTKETFRKRSGSVWRPRLCFLHSAPLHQIWHRIQETSFIANGAEVFELVVKAVSFSIKRTSAEKVDIPLPLNAFAHNKKWLLLIIQLKV